PAQTRWPAVPVDAQSDSRGIRRCDCRRRIPDAPAAARDAPLPPVPQAFGACATAAQAASRARRGDRRGLQPADTQGTADAQSHDQLYDKRAQIGMSAMPLPPSVVLFDLDGTLLDSTPGV